MSTPTPKRGHSISDAVQIPAVPPQQDAAEIDSRTTQSVEQRHAAKSPSTNLVLPRSPLIGRDHEIATIQALLLQEQVALLTLTGPGGIGKTRLAMQVATTLLDHFVDGVYFVSLAPIRDAALVLAAIAETLGIREVGGQPLLQTLQTYLQHRQVLLVLDNFEQVVAAAPLLAPLLAQCGQLKILVTSRATLHLYGEQEFPVPPLALPDAKRLHTIEVDVAPTLAQVASLTLFVQRAMAVQPNFVLDASNIAVVAKICIGLDGLPLAIELAAAKVKLFSPPALLARLQQRLTLLTGGPQDSPARQRTLRDEIAWSYDLLAPGEQMLFRRLAVFVGGFTLEAAQAVCNAAGDLGTDVLNGITSLVDQNLLKQSDQTGRASRHLLGAEPRFHLLETMREYALEQLAASGEAEAIRRQHVDFFLTLVEMTAPALAGANQGVWLAQLAMELDNLRSALSWSLMNIDRAEIALRLAGPLREFWFLSGYWNEGRRWSEAVLALTTATDHTEARAAVLIGAGALAVKQGDHPAADAQLEEGMVIARKLDSKLLVCQTLICFSWIAQAQLDNVQAYAYLKEALVVVRELGDKSRIAQVLAFLANAARAEHNYAGAQSLYAEALAFFQEDGDDWSIAAALNYLGEVAQVQNDYVEASGRFKQSLEHWRATGTLQWQGVADCLNGLATLCALQGQYEESTRLLGAVEALRELLRGSLAMPIHPPIEDNYAILRAELGEAAFIAAWAAGRAWSTEEAVGYALALSAISTPIALDPSPDLLPPIPYPGGLTAREVEVLRLLVQGITYAQIADQLIISRRTVNAHVISIYSKLAVHTRAAATRFAIDHHLV